MILPILLYGHPVLRQKGRTVESVTPAVRQLVADMLETMREASGIGLAAQQIGRDLQVTVIDVRAAQERPSTLEVDGRPVDLNAWMPLVLINPRLQPQGDPATGPEGCLSFPELFADITRPEFVEVTALNGEGNPIAFKAGGLLARAVQHEVDHLNGILFIDRMSAKVKSELRPQLEALHQATKAALA